MAASKGTIESVADIIIEEVGMAKALVIAQRLFQETRGNQSYECTIKSLYACLENRRAPWMRGLSGGQH